MRVAVVPGRGFAFAKICSVGGNVGGIVGVVAGL